MENLIIAPSVLSADFANLGSEIHMLNESEAKWIHIDIMDGMFVPNISFGFPVLEAINKISTKFLDVHLMIEKPERYLTQFKHAGANLITVHFEACTHIHRTIQEIKSLGCQVGIAINPGTPITVLNEIIQLVDLVLIMSVNPGFGGQTFIPNSIQKTKDVKVLANKCGNMNLKIEIDGGVSITNAKDLIAAGANVLVAGNFVFNSKNPKLTISDLLKLGE
ncbi:MAG: ribulose-phosphate 3-epimerase [Cytophagales bacterium]|nr:ribulose-phosphate 3-epimerase [Cytophagales bacterium]